MWFPLLVAHAAPTPHPEPFTADRLAGRWYEVGHPEQCEAGTHVFRYLRDPYLMRYENSAGRYGPSVGKVGVPGTGFGVMGDLLRDGQWRAFRFDHPGKGASGQLVVTPVSPTPEEKKLKLGAAYDLVRCEGDWPEAHRPPPPGAWVSAADQIEAVTLAWLVGSWGETGQDFRPSTGWFTTRCADRPNLPAGTTRTGPDGATTGEAHGALTLDGVDGDAVVGWSTLWGVDGFFGTATPVRLDVASGQFVAPDGDPFVIRCVSDDRMVWTDPRGTFAYAFERCP